MSSKVKKMSRPKTRLEPLKRIGGEITEKKRKAFRIKAMQNSETVTSLLEKMVDLYLAGELDELLDDD